MRIFELLRGKTLLEEPVGAPRSFASLGGYGGSQPPQHQSQEPQTPPMQDGQPIQGGMDQPQPQPLVAPPPPVDMSQMMPQQPQPQQGSEFSAADPNNPMLAAQRMVGGNQPTGREATSLQPTTLTGPQAKPQPV